MFFLIEVIYMHAMQTIYMLHISGWSILKIYELEHLNVRNKYKYTFLGSIEVKFSVHEFLDLNVSVPYYQGCCHLKNIKIF